MKITKKLLKQIIEEEIKKVLDEEFVDPDKKEDEDEKEDEDKDKKRKKPRLFSGDPRWGQGKK